MAIVLKQLWQSRPAGTTAVSVYSPPTDTTESNAKSVIICNTGTTVANASIYLDDNGTTFTEETAVFWQNPVQISETVVFEGFLTSNGGTAANYAVQSSVASTLTFTGSGVEKT